MIEFSSRLADDKTKLSTKFNEIGEIVGEASTWAKLNKQKLVTKEFIQKALDERIDRIKKYDSKYLEMIQENTLLITTDGFEGWTNKWLTVMTIR